MLLWYGFPNVQGVIDGIHIDILKFQGAFVKDYYYHKTRGYSIITQVVVNCNIFFINLFVGHPRSVKDSKVLHTFVLYTQAQYNDCLKWLEVLTNGFHHISWVTKGIH